MTKAPNLSFELIQPYQAQKELTANEALILIDGVLNNSIIEINVNNIPEDPSYGDLYHIGTSPGGEWNDHAGQVALYTEGGWRYFVPRTGLTLWSRQYNKPIIYSGDGWLLADITSEKIPV